MRDLTPGDVVASVAILDADLTRRRGRFGVVRAAVELGRHRRGRTDLVIVSVPPGTGRAAATRIAAALDATAPGA